MTPLKVVAGTVDVSAADRARQSFPFAGRGIAAAGAGSAGMAGGHPPHVAQIDVAAVAWGGAVFGGDTSHYQGQAMDVCAPPPPTVCLLPHPPRRQIHQRSGGRSWLA